MTRFTSKDRRSEEGEFQKYESGIIEMEPKLQNYQMAYMKLKTMILNLIIRLSQKNVQKEAIFMNGEVNQSVFFVIFIDLMSWVF